MLFWILILLAVAVLGILTLELLAYFRYQGKTLVAKITLEYLLNGKQISHFKPEDQTSSQQSPARFQEHPFTAYSLNPDFVNVYNEKIHNRQGFRCDYDLDHLDPDALRVYCCGDSTTYCTPIERNNETWTHYLEQELKKRLNRKVQVINGGVAGFGSYQSYIRLSAYIDHVKPHIVLVYHHARNDLTPFYNGPPAVKDVLPDMSNLIRGLNFHQMAGPINAFARKTYIGKIIALKMQMKFQQFNVHYYTYNITQVPDAPRLLQERFDLEIVKPTYLNMKGMCQIRDLPLVFVTQKVRSKRFDPYLIYVNDSVRELEEPERNCYLCDLEREFPSKREFFYDKLHFNRQGGEKAAEFMTDYLEKAGLLDRWKQPATETAHKN